jgi:tetratricopeptide (TPR) repeat protein
MNDRVNSKIQKMEREFQAALAAHRAGQFAPAIKLYRSVLKAVPNDMETMYLLGTAYSQSDDFEQAEAYLAKALEIDPDHPGAINNMGLTLKGGGKTKEALVFYRRALGINADYADAHNNVGNALELLGELDEAETHLRRALEIEPDHADAHCNLGLVLNRKDRFEEAAASILRGLRLRPDHAISHDFLGSIYKIWGRYDDALACLDTAVALSPNTYSPHNNRGTVLEELGRFDEALCEYERAAQIAPKDAAARWNQAYLFLRQGKLGRGWEAHERRLTDGGQVSIRFPYPQWDGGSLAGKTMLLYAEQGLGDEIMFGSCIPDVIERAGHCIIECAPRLEAFYKRSFPEATVIGSSRNEVGWLIDAPRIDVQAAIGSLPRFLRPTIDSFPPRTAYLKADAERVDYWRSRVNLLGAGLKVGICWRSGLTTGERRKYYSELSQWGDILGMPGVHFVNLQYGECAQELQVAQDSFGVQITNFAEIDLREDIDDSGALMASLDLVISAATAVSEIAGALGIASYRLNSFGKQWEVLGRSDFMPWHPNTRLFDQANAGDWDTQLALVAQALSETVAGHASEVRYLPLACGAQIAVDAAPDNAIHYVLAEQGKWFDPEFDFMLGLARPGMQVVDVGAGAGAYAIGMAGRIGIGQLLAITQGPADTNLLMKSRLRNGLESTLQIAVAATDFSLDGQMALHGMDRVDLVRLAPEMCTADLLERGSRFFTINSPLVMFGIGAGEQFDVAVPHWLEDHGYAIYRLVPGLDLLTPCGSTDELDVYSLNLFACKADRGEQLARDGVLVARPHVLEALPGIDVTYWQQYLRTRPFAAAAVDGWVATAGKDRDWEVYWMALNLFAQAQSSLVPAAERLACLQAAETVLSALLHAHPNLPRLVSLCRILFDLGKREMSVGILNQICELLDAGMSWALDEPLLALSDQDAMVAGAAADPKWVLAMVLAQRENWRAFSTYFTGDESLPALLEVRALGYASDAVERKIGLITARSGQPG